MAAPGEVAELIELTKNSESASAMRLRIASGPLSNWFQSM